jgi:dihydrofolate synthase/folylpolyglutamate synthase
VEFRTLADAERYLEGFINLERRASFDYEKLGLGRIRALLAAIGNPEAAFACIHIAGSNGKGTTAHACEALCRAAGMRPGTYTSPHLTSWTERFRIDGTPVPADALIAGLRRIAPACEELRRHPELRPSFFDVSTALAFELFRSAGIDAGIVEVGLGGRLDSTNVLNARASVITTIQLEHTDKLGDTLEAIAGEKAGIAKRGTPLLHGPLDPEAWGAVAARAVAEDVPLDEVTPRVLDSGEKGIELELPDGRRVRSALLGAHQAVNVALAVHAVETFLGRELAAGQLDALADLSVPARLERFGDLVLDCAHSPDSARALARALATVWPERRWVAVASIARDKDAAGIFCELAPLLRACVLTRAEPIRGVPPEELEPLAWASGIETVETRDAPLEALARAREIAGPREGIVVAGSLYLAGAVRPALCGAPGTRTG